MRQRPVKTLFLTFQRIMLLFDQYGLHTMHVRILCAELRQ